MDIGSFTHDPTGLVKYVFPWESEALKAPGPRVWQAEILEDIRKHLENPETRFQPYMTAVASGHGIGKSALISMIVHWAMSTCEDCKVSITAGTGTQLATKTAPEVQKWFRQSINAHWWDINATSIRVKDPLHQAMWRADFVTWSIQKPDAMAGAHNQGKRIVLIFDEASAIDDVIWETTEGALTDEDTEIIWIAFGNPTRNSGEFYRAITGANRWHKRQIDSRMVEGTNKTLLDAQIKEWGEDSDRARVRIRGEFPRGGSTQFISGAMVAEARKRVVDGHKSMPVIFGVDVARFGDDRSIICKRQGRKAEFIGKFYGVDTQTLGGKVQEAIDEEKPNAVVIDGDGIGGAVYDYLKARGYDRKTLLVEFHGGGTPSDGHKYLNRRAEIWGDMRDWLEGAQIPDEAEIETDLTGPDYGYHPTKGCLVLESKDEMKSRGVDSPDLGDALAMTFAVKVAPPTKSAPAQQFYGSEGWMS
ncbi:MAG: terminase [Gemmatimonadales bacterium]